MKTLFLICITCLLMTGCAGVPSTKVTLGNLKLDSPKNIHADEIEASFADGTHVVMKNYSATNAVDSIAAVAAGNAALADRLIDAMKLLESMAAKGAVASPQPAFYMQVAPVTEPAGYKPLMVPSPPKP